MKIAYLIAGLAFAASPAIAAEVVHQTSVEHRGQTVSVSYEPKVSTELRQFGIGPKASASCYWRSTIAVQRKAHGADGQPIAALTRVVAGEKQRSGQIAGHCAALSEREKASFAGSEDELRAHVTAVAARDADGIRADLTSLAVLHTGASHAR